MQRALSKSSTNILKFLSSMQALPRYRYRYLCCTTLHAHLLIPAKVRTSRSNSLPHSPSCSIGCARNMMNSKTELRGRFSSLVLLQHSSQRSPGCCRLPLLQGHVAGLRSLGVSLYYALLKRTNRSK